LETIYEKTITTKTKKIDKHSRAQRVTQMWQSSPMSVQLQPNKKSTIRGILVQTPNSVNTLTTKTEFIPTPCLQTNINFGLNKPKTRISDIYNPENKTNENNDREKITFKPISKNYNTNKKIHDILPVTNVFEDDSKQLPEIPSITTSTAQTMYPLTTTKQQFQSGKARKSVFGITNPLSIQNETNKSKSSILIEPVCKSQSSLIDLFTNSIQTIQNLPTQNSAEKEINNLDSYKISIKPQHLKHSSSINRVVKSFTYSEN
jgi:hypothetical protein